MAGPFRLDLFSSGDGDALRPPEIRQLLGPQDVHPQAFQQGSQRDPRGSKGTGLEEMQWFYDDYDDWTTKQIRSWKFMEQIYTKNMKILQEKGVAALATSLSV